MKTDNEEKTQEKYFKRVQGEEAIDEKGHYSTDGQSFSSEGVVIASDALLPKTPPRSKVDHKLDKPV